MENLLAGRFKDNYSDDVISSLITDSESETSIPKHLSDYTTTLNRRTSDIWYGKGAMALNTELPDFKTREIAQKLAGAIDKNSVEEIKKLKNEYGDKKEFQKAKKFLDNKCKIVWDVNNNRAKAPYEALKTLGISNKPSLDFLLGNCVRFFEKDGGKTTVQAITSILNNKNLDYTIDNIHKYLADMHLKEKCEYNGQTVKYLMLNHNYDRQKLKELGVSDNFADEVLKSLPIKTRINYFIKNFCALMK